MTKKELRKAAENLPSSKKEELELAAKLLQALLRGPVYNFGFFCNCQPGKTISLKLSASEMYVAVNCLKRLGFPVERTDAGGTPTWQLV